MGGAIPAVSATNISTNDDNIRIIESQSSIPILIINSSENGISYNKFTEFDLQGNDLRIFNNISEGEAPARLIVIEAYNIDLSANIELLGGKADVLFITNTKNNSSINCDNCSFTNVQRSTLVAGYFSSENGSSYRSYFDFNDSVLLGNITTSGRVNVKHFVSPGLQSLELIAKEVSTTGVIDTKP